MSERHWVQRYELEESSSLWLNPSFAVSYNGERRVCPPNRSGASNAFVCTQDIKSRMPIGPFGFGFKQVHLSDTQLAILAALGIGLLL